MKKIKNKPIFRKISKKIKYFYRKFGLKSIILACILIFFLFGGAFILWATTFNLPNLNNFSERVVIQSTKIYDRTGEIILFDVNKDIKRTVVPLSEISPYVKNATIAIEDSNFYNHGGIEPKAILRAVLSNLKDGSLLGGQGGSTITQQVIKNALLTSDKKLSRKLKEWVLAPQLEKHLTKDEIVEVYLNEVPYGGTVYGVQEASRRFFGKDVKDLALAESAYLAALPQAPTFFSPYGNNTDRLDARKDKVLNEMLTNNFITQEEFDSAINEDVHFEKPENFQIKAPHFVMYIIEQLEEKYGVDAVEQGGLKVITTLDWELQEKAQEIVYDTAIANKEKFDAENASITAVEPETGQILVMVGSRDYFDKEIDGNFNISTAERQPGSAFKPFVYAEAFNQGYRPETVVFDLSTEFSSVCASGGSCYQPVNYDGKFQGPISLRNALAQSVNVPAVKVLYLTGIKKALGLAKSLGIETLTNVDQYGLTLVLGGGEVRPLDMAAAYGVFATGGIKHDTVGVLKVEDQKGNVLEEYEEKKNRVLPEQTALLISNVLKDNIARAPAFGSNSALYFAGRDVAAKTGTTNDYRDAWIVGYSPKISVAAWAGNNDNRSMDKKVAGFIVAPMWREFMDVAIEKYEGGTFTQPQPFINEVKPMIAGFWRGESTIVIDSETGEPATSETPPERRKTVSGGGGNGIHSILHSVNKNDPLGPSLSNPNRDPQYSMWESAVQNWVSRQGIIPASGGSSNSGSNNQESALSILSPQNGKDYLMDSVLVIAIGIQGKTLSGGTVFLNGTEIGTIDPITASYSFFPKDEPLIKNSNNSIRVTARDTEGNEYEENISFGILE